MVLSTQKSSINAYSKNGRERHYFHFTDEENEAQRNQVNPRSPIKEIGKPECIPGSQTYAPGLQTTRLLYPPLPCPNMCLHLRTLALSFWRLVRVWKSPWSLRFSLSRKGRGVKIRPRPHPHPRLLTPYDPTCSGHQPPSPVPMPTHVPAAHTASDFGSAPGQTAAPRPVPSGGSLPPRGMDTQSLPQITHSPEPALPSPHLLSHTFLSSCSLALRPVPPARSRYRSDAWSRAWPPATVASSRQRQAPNTILPPPGEGLCWRGKHHKASQDTHPQHHERRSALPSPSSGSPQSISPLAQPQGSLMSSTPAYSVLAGSVLSRCCVSSHAFLPHWAFIPTGSCG